MRKASAVLPCYTVAENIGTVLYCIALVPEAMNDVMISHDMIFPKMYFQGIRQPPKEKEWCM